MCYLDSRGKVMCVLCCLRENEVRYFNKVNYVICG